jgi:hypothetical protein
MQPFLQFSIVNRAEGFPSSSFHPGTQNVSALRPYEDPHL